MNRILGQSLTLGLHGRTRLGTRLKHRPVARTSRTRSHRHPRRAEVSETLETRVWHIQNAYPHSWPGSSSEPGQPAAQASSSPASPAVNSPSSLSAADRRAGIAPVAWSPKDTDLLLRLAHADPSKALTSAAWNRIQKSHFPHRTAFALLFKYVALRREALTGGYVFTSGSLDRPAHPRRRPEHEENPWRAEDVSKLLAIVAAEKGDEIAWSSIAAQIPGSDPRRVRDVWLVETRWKARGVSNQLLASPGAPNLQRSDAFSEVCFF